MRQSVRIFAGVLLFWLAGFPPLSSAQAEQRTWVTGLNRRLLEGDGRPAASLFGATFSPFPLEAVKSASPGPEPHAAEVFADGRDLRSVLYPAEAHEQVYVKFWNAFRLYVYCILAVFGLTFAEWRWMIARQKELRALVEERTRELEAEKAELLRTKTALLQLAACDSLTGLFNRAAIFEILEHEMELARRQKRSFAVVLADLDHFKRINDTYGHLVGDEVLREFARRVTANLRPYDKAGRFGGEELLMLVPGLKDDSTERIRELHKCVTQEPFVFNGVVLRVTCSFGVAWFPGSWFPGSLSSVECLLSLADRALYAAKANGRNQVEVAGRHQEKCFLCKSAEGVG